MSTNDDKQPISKPDVDVNKRRLDVNPGNIEIRLIEALFNINNNLYQIKEILRMQHQKDK